MPKSIAPAAASSDAERKKRKRRRNQLLVLLSPVLLVLSPVLVPVYLWQRARKRRLAKKPWVTLAEVSDLKRPVAPAPIDAAAEATMAEMADTFALCRIIGNDLEPRHEAGQSLSNVRFILDHEADFENCEKFWLINRIFNPETEAAIIALLEDRGQVFERIPFDAEAFQNIGFDFETFEDPLVFVDGRIEDLGEVKQELAVLQAYRARNNYVIHNNGARNAALELCRARAKWALPFDGNCFFTPEGWQALRDGVLDARDKRYFTVPMARVTDNRVLITSTAPIEADEEPQIVFRSDAPLRFDPAHPYGRRPKVELLVHLGVLGRWRSWEQAPFDAPVRRKHPESSRVGVAGWVARLNSGKGHLEQGKRLVIRGRGSARGAAIKASIDMLEARPVTRRLEAGGCLTYDADRLAAIAPRDGDALVAMANEALGRGPFSVTHKPAPGPSGDLHDYFHPAPYYWPDPSKKDGLPYVQRDGERVPGTELYEPEAERYDRTRLQRLFDDTTALALSAHLGGPASHRDHAVTLVTTWFLDPETAMTPALDYAQVAMGRRGNKGTSSGLIETKDVYFFLDAVRLIGDAALLAALRPWITEFRDWLWTSPQGQKEAAAKNNHGTCYDLQTGALSAFLGDVAALQRINLRAQARAMATITPEGDQPHEMTRTLTQHYCAFNLQSSVNLFDLLTNAGLRPWRSDAGARLLTGIERTLSLSAEGWTAEQIKPFDPKRLVPLDAVLRRETGRGMLEDHGAPTCFDPHDGIPPFWRLTRQGAGAIAG